MPPIKGRMIQQQANGSSTSGYSTVKALGGIPRRRGRYSGNNNKNAPLKSVKDEQLKKLRIPSFICKTLPSVKRYANSKGFVDMTEEDEDSKADTHSLAGSEDSTNTILGVKRGRGAENRYHIQATAERRFPGMVWDIAFSPYSEELEVVISCGESVFICDAELNKKKDLERIRLAGGIGFLSDGRIVALCRFMDVLNVYTPSGDFLQDFPCGKSPMALAVNSKDEILVTDCMGKEVLIFNVDGLLLRNIPTSGKNYTLKWPLYMSVLAKDSFVLVDCHLQTVMIFDQAGRYVKSIPMRTYGGNEVLRPHGLCLSKEQDLFIIDNAINTVEVFSLSGVYLQTLVPGEDGTSIRPKVLACSTDGYFAMGGLKGHVRLYKFVSHAEAKVKIKHEVKHEVKEEVTPVRVKIRNESKVKVKHEAKAKVKTEVKMEQEDEVTVIVLD